MWDIILSWAVIILPTLFALTLEFVNEEIRKHRVWKVGVIVFGILLSVLTFWQQKRAATNADTAQRKALDENASKVAKETTDNVSTAVGKPLTDLIEKLTEQNQKLAAQVTAESNDVKAIKGSNLVSGKQPLKVEVANLPSAAPAGQQPPQQPNIHVASMPAEANPQVGKHAVQFILTTDRVMNGGNVRVFCNNGFKQGNAQLASAGVMMSTYYRVQNGNTWETGIASPNWSPSMPLIITLYFDEDDIGECTFTPLS